MSHEHRLEKVVQQQRLQLFFASRLWLEAREENDRLRQIIAQLQARLETHGLPSEVVLTSDPEEQPFLPLFK